MLFPFFRYTDDDWLKPKEAAEVFGVTVTTLRRWADEGRLNVVFTISRRQRRYSWKSLKELDKQMDSIERRAYSDDDYLRPREVAELFGVQTTTVIIWAKNGLITGARTPGGERRYRYGDIKDFTPPHQARYGPGSLTYNFPKAVQLYRDGASIRAIASRYDVSYNVMRRYLHIHTELRPPNGGSR